MDIIFTRNLFAHDQVTRNYYYRHVRALISFPRLLENSGAAGKNARPQTHRTLRYTNAHLFRARPCNRSVYVTEKAVYVFRGITSYVQT